MGILSCCAKCCNHGDRQVFSLAPVMRHSCRIIDADLDLPNRHRDLAPCLFAILHRLQVALRFQQEQLAYNHQTDLCSFVNSISCGDELLDCPRLGGGGRNFNCAGRHDAVVRQARGRSEPKTRKPLNTLALTPPPRPGPGVTAAAAASDSDHLTTATLGIARHSVVWRVLRAMLGLGATPPKEVLGRLPLQAYHAGRDPPVQQRRCHFISDLKKSRNKSLLRGSWMGVHLFVQGLALVKEEFIRPVMATFVAMSGPRSAMISSPRRLIASILILCSGRTRFVTAKISATNAVHRIWTYNGQLDFVSEFERKFGQVKTNRLRPGILLLLCPVLNGLRHLPCS